MSGHDDVVPGAAGLKLGEHHLIGIEDIHFDDAVVFLFKTLHQFRGEVVGPGVDVEDLFTSAAGESHGRQHNNEEEEEGVVGFHGLGSQYVWGGA